MSITVIPRDKIWIGFADLNYSLRSRFGRFIVIGTRWRNGPLTFQHDRYRIKWRWGPWIWLHDVVYTYYVLYWYYMRWGGPSLRTGCAVNRGCVRKGSIGCKLARHNPGTCLISSTYIGYALLGHVLCKHQASVWAPPKSLLMSDLCGYFFLDVLANCTLGFRPYHTWWNFSSAAYPFFFCLSDYLWCQEVPKVYRNRETLTCLEIYL